MLLCSRHRHRFQAPLSFQSPATASNTQTIALCTTVTSTIPSSTTKISLSRASILQLSQIVVTLKLKSRACSLISFRRAKTKRSCVDTWNRPIRKTSLALWRRWLRLVRMRWSARHRAPRLAAWLSFKCHPMDRTGRIWTRLFKFTVARISARSGPLTSSHVIHRTNHSSSTAITSCARETATKPAANSGTGQATKSLRRLGY